MTEKMAMADGRVSADQLLEGAKAAARHLVAANFAEIAERSGTPIGASLFGAIAASGALPFTRAQFEQAIERGGVGVAASLKAFAAGHDAAARGQPQSGADALPRPGPRLALLASRIEREFKPAAQRHLLLGIARLADYQDEAYAGLYLDRMQSLQERAAATALADEITSEAARHLALWMSYEDTVRVAELKARKSRFERVQRAMKPDGKTLVMINEYFHPRVEELADTLPAWLGQAVLGTPWLKSLLGRFMREGRVVRSSTLRGFLLLYFISSLKPLRPGSLRFARETQAMAAWLEAVRSLAQRDYALACEVARCQTLIKGYGDTHERGSRNFASIMALLPKLQGDQAAAQVSQLRKAALADDSGQALVRELSALQAVRA